MTAIVTVTPIDDARSSPPRPSRSRSATAPATRSARRARRPARSPTTTRAPVVSAVVVDATGAETASEPIVFGVSARPRSTQIVVNLTWSGTAIYGTDYTVTRSPARTLSADGAPADARGRRHERDAHAGAGRRRARRAHRDRDDDARHRHRLHARHADERDAARSSTTTRRRTVSVTATDATAPSRAADPIVFTVTRAGSRRRLDRRRPDLERHRDARHRLHGRRRRRRALGGRHAAHARGRRRRARRSPLTPIDDALVESVGDGDADARRPAPATRSARRRARAARSPTTTRRRRSRVRRPTASGAEQGSDPIDSRSRGRTRFKQIVVNLTWSGTATLGADYTVSASGGTLSANGLAADARRRRRRRATLTVTPVDDTLVEATETVDADARRPAPATRSARRRARRGSIVDNDSADRLRRRDRRRPASEQGQRPDRLHGHALRRAHGTIVVALGVERHGDARHRLHGRRRPAARSRPTGRTLTLGAGATSATVTLTPVDDTTVECTETVTLTLGAGHRLHGRLAGERDRLDHRQRRRRRSSPSRRPTRPAPSRAPTRSSSRSRARSTRSRRSRRT